jgi:hypothetical protein
MEALKRLLDGDDALPPLPPGENERKSKLRTLLSRVGRLMKSNFVDTTNKKTILSPISGTAPPAKRQRMRQVVTPTRASPTTPSRGYNRTVSLSESTILSTPNRTNNAISEVMHEGLGISRTNLLPPSPLHHSPSNVVLLSTSNLGLRRLSISSIIELDVGATIVVVFSESSLVSKRFESAIHSQLKIELRFVDGCDRIAVVERTMIDRHSFLRHGQTYYEFPCRIVSYPKRHELFDCSVDESTLSRWVDQGEGFTVEFLNYSRRIVLKWKELRDTDVVECWELADRSTKLNEWDFGRTRKITSVVADFKSKARQVEYLVHVAVSLS